MPVLLAHGFLMDQSMFAAQVAALRDRYRVITWDARGFGKTQFDGQPFSYWDLANDALGLLDHLGIEHAVVGGMSQGGYLSLRMALTAPQRVLGLILLNSQAGAEDPEKAGGYRQMLDTWASAGPVDPLVNTVASIILDHEAENARWISKWKVYPQQHIVEPGNCLLAREDLTLRLPSISCPALVIHGTRDNAIAATLAQTMAEQFGGKTTFVLIDGATHIANLTHPQRVNTALLDFLHALPTD